MEKDTDAKEKNVELWNPTAAVNWSLLFSPVFGAWIQMKNWTALGEMGKARISLVWMIVSIPFVLFWPFTVVWYVFSGMWQGKYIKKRNTEYRKKGWGKPVLAATGIYIIYLTALTVLFTGMALFGGGPGTLEDRAIPALSQKLHTKRGANAPTCESIIITHRNEGLLTGVACLSNGENIDIIIMPDDDDPTRHVIGNGEIGFISF